MSLDFQGAGGIMAAFGAFAGAQGQQTSLRNQADIAGINATTAERTAQSALYAGQQQAQRSMLATANLKGQQQASFAANGVDLGEGSANRTLTSTDVLGQVDANTIAANAVRSAWGYRAQASNFQNEALQKRASADSISPWMAGASSLMNSAGSVASNWYQLDKAGALDAYASKPSSAGGNAAYSKS